MSCIFISISLLMPFPNIALKYGREMLPMQKYYEGSKILLESIPQRQDLSDNTRMFKIWQMNQALEVLISLS